MNAHGSHFRLILLSQPSLPLVRGGDACQGSVFLLYVYDKYSFSVILAQRCVMQSLSIGTAR